MSTKFVKLPETQLPEARPREVYCNGFSSFCFSSSICFHYTPPKTPCNHPEKIMLCLKNLFRLF
ncbi:MAG: hypothetical protein Q8N69_00815, partial [bacterium]|nr:hypothetical protein [bacterium]